MTMQFKTIQDIYDAYDIMPQLREHMIRVAAVGGMIARRCELPQETVRDIELALLLHDMGNIIKFNLDKFPEGTKIKGVEYWKEVQQKYIEKYGTNEDDAHVAIATELHAPENVIQYMKIVGFVHLCDLVESDEFERKICEYADLRVAPHGIVSLEERLEDGKKRYNIPDADERWDLRRCSFELEQQLVEKGNFIPDEITDDAVVKDVQRLQNVSIEYTDGYLTMN